METNFPELESKETAKAVQDLSKGFACFTPDR